MSTYRIKSGFIGSTELWNIVDEEGQVVTSLHGPMSGIMALAACEHMNSNSFSFNGWTRRFDNLMIKDYEENQEERSEEDLHQEEILSAKLEQETWEEIEERYPE